MDKKIFKGVYSAIFSVYDENMNVKKDTMRKLVNYHLDNGLSGFYVGGNTGECTVLPNKTRIQILETVMEENNGGQIIAHIGAGHFDDVKELLDHANSCKVDAVASLPPSLTSYYDDEAIFEYYKYLAENSKAPVLAYITNVYRGDVVELARKFSEIDNMLGIKLTIPDYFAHERINRACGELNILNGPDECLLCGLITGADGGIGTSYNVAPKTVFNIYDNFIKGNIKEAYKYQHKLNTFIDAALGKNGIAYWKAFLEVKGFDMGYTVFPARPNTAEEMKEIEKFMKENPDL